LYNVIEKQYKETRVGTEKRHEVIIVGGGPAGLSAGIYCMRAGLKTLLFEKGLLGGQVANPKMVDNYPGVESVTGFELAEKLAKHAKSFNLTVLQEEIESVTTSNGTHVVRTAGGERFESITLILGPGGTAKKLNVPGEAEYFGSGVSYCGTCDGFFFKGKTVCVVGGGDNAAEEALHLARLAKKVYLIHRRDELRANRVLQQQIRNESTIEIIWNSVVRAVKGAAGVVNAAVVENTRTGETRDLATDGIFIRIGFFPNNKLIPPEITINDQGYALTDEKCETNVPGIFAIGDLRQKYANQIVVAAADGCIAALAAAHYVELHKAGSLQS
jgi:thioredoxin reductase (NADPH)